MTQSHTVYHQPAESAAGTTQADSAHQTSGVGRLSEKIRVCHVSMCLTTGGLERLLVEFAKRTNPEQYDLQFAVLGDVGQPAEDIKSLGKTVTQINTGKSGRWSQFLNLRKLFVEQRIDIVHSHNTYAHFYASIAGYLAGVPVILNTQHGRGCGNSLKQRGHFLLANRLAHQILAVSEDSARICQKQDPLSRSKITALWNGIDLDRFSFHGPQNKPHAISVARLSPEKDFPTLLQATRLVVDLYPEFKLTMVGDGLERSSLEKLCSELNLDSHVTFLGERSDVPDLLKQAGMFVSSSSTEGISLTLLEALAVGLPIITTDVGGNPEIIEEGTTGYLVPSRNPQRLAEAICNHLEKPEAWGTIAATGRASVEKKFHINRMIKDYEELYRSYILEKRGKL